MKDFESQILEYSDHVNYAQNEFIYNDYEKQRKVSIDIIKYLDECDEFYFSVAFITEGGLTNLKLALQEAEKRGVKGKVLTTNYLSFSEPKALKTLLGCKNIETKMYYLTEEDRIGFHTKGYIFRKGDQYNVIIGSSNLTDSAINSNKEWNSLIKGTIENKAISSVIKEFNNMFYKATPLEEVLEKYTDDYKAQLIIRKTNEENRVFVVPKPNDMQKQFIFNLNELISNGGERGLLISATGTGKTYASAFACRELDPFKVNKLLFITHRETILNQAKETFEKVFHNENKKMAIFSGTKKEIDNVDFIFASYSTIYKKENLLKFDKNEFDMIIIDEVHRVGENHYQDIVNYFEPKFLLGMSATPDRTDNYNIYELFDHNILYEIRLMQALDLDFLVPFKYFGITDLSVNNIPIDDKSNFNLLTSDERIKHILYQSEYFGYSGNRLKCLVFANSVEVGAEISRKLNLAGKRSVFLSGADSIETREDAINRLEQDEDNENALDFIVSRDILNEGVDIPSVNQIILLRPTESSIVFLQQLGRGLRKYENKDYVVVLDFIGNYEKNFNIVKAFNKDSWNKGNAVRATRQIMPGLSNIAFDKIAKENIFKSINNATLNSKKEIYSSYLDIKNRLNHIPTLIELDTYATTPVNVFLDDQIYKSYYEFLISKNEIDFSSEKMLNNKERSILMYLSKYCFDGKRKCDIELIEDLVFKGQYYLKPDEKADYIKDRIQDFLEMHTFDTKIKWKFGMFADESKTRIIPTNDLNEICNNQTFIKYLKDNLSYAHKANREIYNSSNSFVLFEKYSRGDVSRIANLNRGDTNTIYGYRVKEKEGIIPIFINYAKQQNDIKYHDKFITPSFLNWSSRSNLTLDSNEIKKLISLAQNGTCKIRIFVQKSNLRLIKDEGFYYLGEAKIIEKENFFDTETNKNLVHFKLLLDEEVRQDIYEYLTLDTDD